MKGRQTILSVVLVGLMAGVGSAAESDSSQAGVPLAERDRLAQRALDLLQVAEAAESKSEKIAAYKRCRDVAKRAVALDQSNADAHFAVFAAEGRLELLNGAVPNPVNLYRAQERLDHVLELDPGHSAGLAAKGGLYRQLPWMLGGDLEKAESFLKRAIELNPEAIGARIELAATYFDKGEREKCAPILDEARAIAEKQGKLFRLKQVARLRAEISSD